MATIEELTLEGVAIRNDILKAEQTEVMKAVFSEDLLNYINSKGITTLEQAKNYSVSFNKLTLGSIKDLKGMEYMGEDSSFNGISQSYENINLSGLKNTSTLSVYSAGISGKVYLNPDSLISRFYLFNNSITDVFGLEDIKHTVSDLNLGGNLLSTNSVNSVLRQVRKSVENNAITINKFSLISNSIPTDGALNADYVYLINSGIPVSIDTI